MYAACRGEEAPVYEFLISAAPNASGSAAGMWALFKLYAGQGKQGLTTTMFHEANKKEAIWEFVKGQLRVYCFVDDGGLVILTHGVLKKTQRAVAREIAAACRVRDQYSVARDAHMLEIEDWSDRVPT